MQKKIDFLKSDLSYNPLILVDSIFCICFKRTFRSTKHISLLTRNRHISWIKPDSFRYAKPFSCCDSRVKIWNSNGLTFNNIQNLIPREPIKVKFHEIIHFLNSVDIFYRNESIADVWGYEVSCIKKLPLQATQRFTNV